MKFKNELNRSDIRKAVIHWITGEDGFDGAIGGIIGEIPWNGEMQSVLPWDKVEEPFSAIIPSREQGLDLLTRLITDLDGTDLEDGNALKPLRDWVNGIVDGIEKAYEEALKILNERAECSFKYQVWRNGEPIVLCDTLNEAEAKMRYFNGDYVEWIAQN